MGVSKKGRVGGKAEWERRALSVPVRVALCEAEEEREGKWGVWPRNKREDKQTRCPQGEGAREARVGGGRENNGEGKGHKIDPVDSHPILSPGTCILRFACYSISTEKKKPIDPCKRSIG